MLDIPNIYSDWKDAAAFHLRDLLEQSLLEQGDRHARGCRVGREAGFGVK